MPSLEVMPRVLLRLMLRLLLLVAGWELEVLTLGADGVACCGAWRGVRAVDDAWWHRAVAGGVDLG